MTSLGFAPNSDSVWSTLVPEEEGWSQRKSTQTNWSRRPELYSSICLGWVNQANIHTLISYCLIHFYKRKLITIREKCWAYSVAAWCSWCWCSPSSSTTSTTTCLFLLHLLPDQGSPARDATGCMGRKIPSCGTWETAKNSSTISVQYAIAWFTSIRETPT